MTTYQHPSPAESLQLDRKLVTEQVYYVSYKVVSPLFKNTQNTKPDLCHLHTLLRFSSSFRIEMLDFLPNMVV